MSILRANPSLRDTRSYLASFGLRSQLQPPLSQETKPQPPISHPNLDPSSSSTSTQVVHEDPNPSPVAASILNPVYRRTALVKIQGPFTDIQLDSITRGLVYLEKLGLV